MNLSDIKLKLNMSEKLDNLARRVRKNDIISAYYESLYEEVIEDWNANFWEWSDSYLDFMTKFRKHCRGSIDNVRNCSRYFNIDYYRLQATKDITKVGLCHNKFCDNCQNLISVERYKKYAPIIDELSRCFSIAHAVFTVPNCKPQDLKSTLDTMYEQFKYMIRYLSCKAKIRGIDFARYGFLGGIRSVEITKNEKEGTFHPHFHCIFVFSKQFHINNGRNTINSFSFDREHRYIPHRKGAAKKVANEPRFFTDLEVLLQKIWYLRLNGIEVTKVNIDSIEEGYSVICERARDYKEIFKYATKGIFKETQQLDFVGSSYRDFVCLCYALYKRRLIQGFGCFWHCDFSESINQKAEGDLNYQRVIESLRQVEDPETMLETLKVVLEEKDKKNVVYISRQNISAILEGASDGA